MPTGRNVRRERQETVMGYLQAQHGGARMPAEDVV